MKQSLRELCEHVAWLINYDNLSHFRFLILKFGDFFLLIGVKNVCVLMFIGKRLFTKTLVVASLNVSHNLFSNRVHTAKK